MLSKISCVIGIFFRIARRSSLVNLNHKNIKKSLFLSYNTLTQIYTIKKGKNHAAITNFFIFVQFVQFSALSSRRSASLFWLQLYKLHIFLFFCLFLCSLSLWCFNFFCCFCCLFNGFCCFCGFLLHFCFQVNNFFLLCFYLFRCFFLLLL